jgi:hypothetical protein
MRLLQPLPDRYHLKVDWADLVGYFRLGNIVTGAFTPVLAKHTKHLSLVGGPGQVSFALLSWKNCFQRSARRRNA